MAGTLTPAESPALIFYPETGNARTIPRTLAEFKESAGRSAWTTEESHALVMNYVVGIRKILE